MSSRQEGEAPLEFAQLDGAFDRTMCAGKRPPPPLDKHQPSFFQCFFTWIVPLMDLGYSRALKEEDLPDLAEGDQSAHGLARLERHWTAEINGHASPSLGRAFSCMFSAEMLSAMPYSILGSVTKIAQTQVLGRLVLWYESAESSQGQGWWLSALLVLCQLIVGLSHHAYVIRTMRIGMRMRASCTALLFKKALSLRAAEMQQTTAGHVTNLASTDIERFEAVALLNSTDRCTVISKQLIMCPCGPY